MPARVFRAMYNPVVRNQPAPSEPTLRSRPHRSPLRLPDFDYSTPGAYFITVCTYHRTCLLGDVRHDRVLLTDIGSMVNSAWSELPSHYPALQTDAFVVMPNHVHGIIFLTGEEPRPSSPPDGRAREPAPTFGLLDVVHRFKTLTTRRFAEFGHASGSRPVYRHLWQRSFYEHVVRDDATLLRIREYIPNNPLAWALDRENPSAGRTSHPSGPTESWEA